LNTVIEIKGFGQAPQFFVLGANNKLSGFEKVFDQLPFGQK